MTNPKSLFALGLALVCATLTSSLAVCAHAQTVNFLYRFPDIEAYTTSLVQGTDGNLYSAAYAGGAYSLGEVFRMTPAGEVTTVYSFCSQPNCADGSHPISPPVLASDGNFYGVTSEGGSSSQGAGTVYKVTSAGALTTLHVFCSALSCADGSAPHGLIQASNGNFYGTTGGGGQFSEGTIFEISPTGAFKTLYNFCSLQYCADGKAPCCGLIQGKDGNFYGTTYAGGNQRGGVFYELSPAGNYKVLYNFCDPSAICSNGASPSAVVQDADGNFFGTTSQGGQNTVGTAFEITPANRYVVLHTFTGSDGIDSSLGLTLANDGNLYGLGTFGGLGDNGTIYQVGRTGLFKLLYDFDSGYSATPLGPLFQATNGLLYGATYYGSIFSLSNHITPLVKTAPLAGPVGERVIILGNKLRGSTSVTFNGVEAAFTVNSDTYITATVPTGATTGVVSVNTPSGTLNSNPQFVVTK